MPNIVLGQLFKLSTKAGEKLAKRILEEPLVERAINATAEHFQDMVVAPALQKWCASGEFEDLLERFKRGERSITDASVVESFIKAGEFYNAGDTASAALTVLSQFDEQLQNELYKSEEGLATLASREEVLHVETRQDFRAALTEHKRDFSTEMSEKLANVLASAQTERTGEIVDKVLRARVEDVRQLMREGRFRSAHDQLLRIRSEASTEQASGSALFVIALNVGLCAIQLEELESASRELDIALALRPNEPEALAYASFVAARLGQSERTRTLALQALERLEHPNPISTVIRALCMIDDLNAVDDYFQSHEARRSDPDCLLVLGQCRYDRGHFSEAEELLRKAIAAGSTSPYAHLFLALSIFFPVRDALITTPRLRWKTEHDLLARLVDVKQELTCAINLFGKFEDRRNIQDALVNRAAVNGMLDDVEGGLRDCEAVLAEDESNEVAIRNKGMLLSKANRYSEAIAAFAKIHDPNEREQIVIPFASSYIGANRPTEAVGLLEPLIDIKATDPRQIVIVELLVTAYMNTGQKEKAEKLLTDLQIIHPGNAALIGLRAEMYLAERDVETAIQLFREALACSQAEQRDILSLQLAEVYFRNQQWADAAALYPVVISEEVANAALRNYIVSLFNSGTRAEALRLARKARGSKAALPVVTEVEAACLEYVGDLDGARQLYLALSEIEPRNPLHKLKIAAVDLRRNKLDEAREQVTSIPYNDIKDNPVALMRVAEMRSVLKLDGVLPLAYRARQLGYNQEDIHHAYMRIFLNREMRDKAMIDNGNEVIPDTTIHLLRGTEKLRFTILREEPIHRERDEISLNDPVAKKLLGRRKGEEVQLKKSPLEELSYEITEIQSKYVSAFQETMLKFTRWFPDSAAMHQVEVKDNDFTRVLNQLDRRYESVTEALRAYKNLKMPIALFSKWLGRSILETWAGMTTNSLGRIFSASGTLQEKEEEHKLISSQEEVVLDLSAVLTLGLLKLLDVLPKRFKKIFITQSTLDVIIEELVNYGAENSPSAVIGRTEYGYFHQEVSADERNRWSQFLEGCRDFLLSNSTVIPAAESLSMNPAKSEEMEGVLGTSGATSILAAKERTLSLYSDDLGLRRLATSEWQVQTFSTQGLLIDLVEGGLLNRDQYNEAIRKLILANYRHVTITADELMWVFRDDLANKRNAFIRVIEVLRGPDADQDSCIAVAADLTKLVWMDDTLFERKLTTLDLILEAIAHDRLTSQVVQKFKGALRHRFRLLPLQLDVILKSINIWEQQNRLQKGMVD